MSAIPQRDEPLPTGDDKVASVRTMFDTIAPRYDLVNRIMTFGLDVRWRNRTVNDLALPSGSRIADLACGTGDFCRTLADRGEHTPIGFDLAFGMLAHARTEAPLVHADALRLPVPDGSMDGVTCGFALRNFVELDPFFAELARIVRPGGRIALLDVSRPRSRFLRTGYDVYFGRVVPFIGGLLSNADAYHYLPRSLSYLPEPEVLSAQVEAAGFAKVEHHQLNGGLVQLITATR
ncbi:MAG: ubiquinone/menaquinone biosynthesis methyltransferase [Actinomycetota bacterium]